MANVITIDAATRRALVDAAKEIFSLEKERFDEVWLTKEKLMEQFGMFTEDWIRRYGCELPRTRVTVKDAQTGAVRCSQWAYARNEIQRMIEDNRLDFTVSGKVRGRVRME